MGATFVDIAQNCAPMVQVETLAAVVSLESRFLPFNIRVNSGMPLPAQPASKAEAIEMATSLIADHQDIQIGLGGIGVEELRKLNLSVSDAFDPCLNLKATATLLDGYYRLALRFGADPARAETVMLQSWYGRDDPSVGEMVRYDEQVRREAKRLSPKLASLAIGGPLDRADTAEEQAQDQLALPVPKQAAQTEETASWDVFSSRRHSSVLVFQNERSEQSE
ncbi:lytic transglycosylase domain-containing protein [Agrobacterium salinitolerans]|uniref:Lytic transglycosylase domain-containing protein n=1 Tax=Agrobacterium salinitolerans TaxID=1183413 RepID=A0A9X3KRY6_9HYPH|nr:MULTISPECIES: lytic transglycosylase domain-containing protein [Agrobacterium]MCZ7854710.1 lytic transglycosylase domain-containing protein [Agrobacterium salinitolerans]MCZ7893888.1 lytic transglycosylase domain-containing protein [Agrobacterium salinitolerans]MCZ7939840.1 lytic transglycosylase domain-containing protein [Agrobacterium salinitolerans]TRA84189.1 type IV secretion system protein VirB1 [Agrobacterium salinitolerans]